MRFLLPLFLFASTVFAAPAATGDECGSHPDPSEVAVAEQFFANATAELIDAGDPSVADAPPIDVYWNVIYKDTTVAGGYTPLAHITNSITALNNAYVLTGFRFKLKSVKRTKNAVWWASTYGSGAQATMKNTLHQGDRKVLNVYTSSIPGLRGYATFPWQYNGAPKQDGVVVEPSTLVGGSSVGYNFGITLVHEVGHWAGLYHTFQGGCTNPGDYVSDTPQEATASNTCNTSRNTCPNNPGNDPVKNYMDYSPHSCKDRFSAGQRVRMRQQMQTYRGLLP